MSGLCDIKEKRNAYINFTRNPETKTLWESRNRQETYIKSNFRVCQKKLDLSGSQWGNLMDGDRLEDLGVDGNIILNWILQEQDSPHSIQSPAVQTAVNTIKNVYITRNVGNFSTSWGPVSFSRRTQTNELAKTLRLLRNIRQSNQRDMYKRTTRDMHMPHEWKDKEQRYFKQVTADGQQRGIFQFLRLVSCARFLKPLYFFYPLCQLVSRPVTCLLSLRQYRSKISGTLLSPLPLSGFTVSPNPTFVQFYTLP